MRLLPAGIIATGKERKQIQVNENCATPHTMGLEIF